MDFAIAPPSADARHSPRWAVVPMGEASPARMVRARWSGWTCNLVMVILSLLTGLKWL